MRSHRPTILIWSAISTVAAVAVAAADAPGRPARTATVTAPGRGVTVSVDTGRAVGHFDPVAAIGTTLDGQQQGAIAQTYTAHNLRAMGSAGISAISYRLRTELGVEAWHWNPAGRFSDAVHHQGYWTSSARSGPRLGTTFGYALPRRGDSIDQANDTGYSRLDDGDAATIWKSDPYLDPHFSGRAPAQWVLVDLGRRRPVDAIRIDWSAPWATRFAVQWWTGANAIYPAAHPAASWRDFPRARFSGSGGSSTLRLGTRPAPVRFVRVLLERSSHTAPRGARDVRDRLGFAIRELGLGTIRGGRFTDLVRHRPDGGRQTTTMASSTDPWHRAIDRDPSYEQPSFDQVIGSRLTRGTPLMVPVPLLYSTPADAVNELRWLHARHYAVGRVELGEEPDGQLSEPEAYAALYARFASALRTVDRRVPLGGPGYQTSLPDWRWWPDARGRRSWTGRLVAELIRRGALGNLNYFSFEWYPFDLNCRDTAGQLVRQPGLLADVVGRQRRAGLPSGIPLVITELGYSAFAGRVEDDLPGAVLDVDAIARLLALGGQSAYVYGLEPSQPMQETQTCRTWGNLGLFNAGDTGQANQPLAAFWGLGMLRRDWAAAGQGRDTLVAASTDLTDVAGHAPVGSYAVRRPDGRLSVLLLNRDVAAAHPATLRIDAASSPSLDAVQLGGVQYAWHPRGPHGFARPDGPPARFVVPAGAAVTLPPASITVLSTPARTS